MNRTIVIGLLLGLLKIDTAQADGGLNYRWVSSAPNLIVEDFTGDNISDVFLATGNNWYLSESGTGRWTRINTHNDTIAELL